MHAHRLVRKKTANRTAECSSRARAKKVAEREQEKHDRRMSRIYSHCLWPGYLERTAAEMREWYTCSYEEAKKSLSKNWH